MKDIILPIKPKFAEGIYCEEKTFELRTRVLKKIAPGSKVFMYESAPIGLITGYFVIDEIMFATPFKIWTQTNGKIGISRDEFELYFDGVERGYAISLKDVHQLSTHVEPAKLGIKNLQSAIYVKDEMLPFLKQ